jgi:hypothetical protein
VAVGEGCNVGPLCASADDLEVKRSGLDVVTHLEAAPWHGSLSAAGAEAGSGIACTHAPK